MPAKPKDPIQSALRKAKSALGTLREQVYGDTRTNSTSCAGWIDGAAEVLGCADRWYAELLRAEAEDEKPAPATTVAAPECWQCGEEIDPDEVSVCGGCGKQTCPDCMGADEFCVECEENEDAE